MPAHRCRPNGAAGASSRLNNNNASHAGHRSAVGASSHAQDSAPTISSSRKTVIDSPLLHVASGAVLFAVISCYVSYGLEAKRSSFARADLTAPRTDAAREAPTAIPAAADPSPTFGPISDMSSYAAYRFPAPNVSPLPPFLFFYVLQSTGRLLLRGGADEGSSTEACTTGGRVAGGCAGVDAWMQKARDYQEEGDAANAVRLLKKVQATEPGHVEAIGRLGLTYEFEYADFDQAEALYRRALALKPTDVTLMYDLAVFLQQRRGNLDGAQGLYESALALAPSDSVVLNNYGVFMHEVRKDAAAAERYFTRAIAAAPSSGSALCNFASLLERSGPARLDEAEKAYAQALALEPQETATLYNYAIFCEEKRGDASHAADLYRRVLQIDPEDTDALNNYALLLQHHTKDLAEAKALLLRALQAEPLELATLNNLAVLHEDALRDPAEAEKYYKRALELAPGDVTSLCNYGGFLKHSLGDVPAAEAVLHKASLCVSV